MAEKIEPKDNSANMRNANKGSPGTNRQYDQVQGNRGKQIGQGKQAGSSSKSGGGKR